MSEFFKKLGRIFSKSSYPQDRFLREKLTMEQKLKKNLSAAKDKIKELVFGEKKNEDCPYVFVETEETHVRKLTGVRYTGGKKEPNMFELMHEKESQLLLGIVPDKPPYPATSPPPDPSDRPCIPDDSDSDYDDDDFGYEKETIEREVKIMRRSRFTSLGESLSVE